MLADSRGGGTQSHSRTDSRLGASGEESQWARVGAIPVRLRPWHRRQLALIPNEAEQAVIAEIQMMRSGGMRLQGIARVLSTRGIPIKTGKSRRWTHQSRRRLRPLRRVRIAFAEGIKRSQSSTASEVNLPSSQEQQRQDHQPPFGNRRNDAGQRLAETGVLVATEHGPTFVVARTRARARRRGRLAKAGGQVATPTEKALVVTRTWAWAEGRATGIDHSMLT